MNKAAFLLIFLLLQLIVFGQSLNDVPNVKVNLYAEGAMQLFNPAEIKARGFKKAYLVETSGYRDAEGAAQNKDTIKIYEFNPQGQLDLKYRYFSSLKKYFDT